MLGLLETFAYFEAMRSVKLGELGVTSRQGAPFCMLQHATTWHECKSPQTAKCKKCYWNVAQHSIFQEMMCRVRTNSSVAEASEWGTLRCWNLQYSKWLRLLRQMVCKMVEDEFPEVLHERLFRGYSTCMSTEHVWANTRVIVTFPKMFQLELFYPWKLSN